MSHKSGTVAKLLISLSESIRFQESQSVLPKRVRAKMCVDRMPESRNQKVGGSCGCFRVKEWLNGSCLVDARATIIPAENQIVLPEYHIEKACMAKDGANIEPKDFTNAAGLLVQNCSLEDWGEYQRTGLFASLSGDDLIDQVKVGIARKAKLNFKSAG